MNISINDIFPVQSSLVKEKKCPFCKKEIADDEFLDELSEKEFKISGLCQSCQDDVFGTERIEVKNRKKVREKKLSKEAAAKFLGIDLSKVIEESCFGDFSDVHVKIDLWERHISKIKSNSVYFLPANVDDYVKAANILAQVNFGTNNRSEGYGGSIWKFKCTDGKEYEVQGPWHSNCDALKQHTGIDLTNNHKFFMIVAEKSLYDIISDNGRLKFDYSNPNKEYSLRDRAVKTIWTKGSYSFNAYNLIDKFEWKGSWEERKWQIAKKVLEHNKPLYYIIKSSGGSTTFNMTIKKAKELRDLRTSPLDTNFGIKLFG